MALGRLEVQIISRGAGRSALAASAYRSGQELHDPRTGRLFDYRSRHGVLHHELVEPPAIALGHAPSNPRAFDPIYRTAGDARRVPIAQNAVAQIQPSERAFNTIQDLWAVAEQFEKRVDAQLAREFLGSLPHELSREAQIQCVREFVAEQLTPHGIVVQFDLHGPDRRGDRRNVHAHLLTTMRPLIRGPDGPTFGPKLRDLNSRAQLQLWREAWERCCNRALEREHVPERVSLSRQALTPEPKQGPLATELERHGKRTNAGDARRAARTTRERRAREAPRERTDARTFNAWAARALHGVSAFFDLGAASRAQTVIEHPGRDRWFEFADRQRMLNAIKDTSLAQWRMEVTNTGMSFFKQTKQIDVSPGRIKVTGSDDIDVEAILDAIVAQGWTTVRLASGSAQNKAKLVLAALERGIGIVAQDKDKPMVAALRKTFVERQRARATAEEARTIAAGEAEPAVDPERAKTEIVTEALQLLTQNTSTFARRDVERLIEKLVTDTDRRPELTLAVMTQPDVIELGPDQWGNPRYTTRTMLAKEQRFIELSLKRANEILVPVNTKLQDEIIAKKGFTEHQAAAFRKLTSGRRVVHLRGIAGGGKSYVMGGVREYFERCSLDVFGNALAGVAADGLANESGIKDSRTNEQWAVYFDSNPAMRDSVLVRDEFGMTGTDDALALADKFDMVIYVGDFRQLQPISAGAPFRALADRLPDEAKAELTEVRRQKVEWMQEATRLFYEGKTREALKLYEEHGRWIDAATSNETKQRIIDDWRRDGVERPDLERLILAYTRADVLDLALRTRDVRRANNEYEGPDVELQMENGRRLMAVNERIRFTQPWAPRENGQPLKRDDGQNLKIRNGTRAILTGIDLEANTITVRIPMFNDRTIKVPLKEFRGFDYSDVGTTHTGQGRTLDLAYYYVTPHKGVQADLAYVGKTRHRIDSHLYWSHDQFRNRNHVYRTLERFQPKDYSLDYSRADSYIGLGVPMQGPNGVALRAPHQIRGELMQVLRTAEHLREVAPEAQRANAERAFYAVRGWCTRIDKQLRDLESRGVRAITIKGFADALPQRLDLLERSVGDAVARANGLSREHAHERLNALLRETDKLRSSIETNAAKQRAVIAAAPPTLLPTPNTAIAQELARHEAAVRDAATPAARDSAQTAQREAQAYYERPDVFEMLQSAFNERLALYERDQDRREAAVALLTEYRRQDAELATIALDIRNALEGTDLTHDDLDRVAERVEEVEVLIESR